MALVRPPIKEYYDGHVPQVRIFGPGRAILNSRNPFGARHLDLINEFRVAIERFEQLDQG